MTLEAKSVSICDDILAWKVVRTIAIELGTPIGDGVEQQGNKSSSRAPSNVMGNRKEDEALLKDLWDEQGPSSRTSNGH